MAVSSLFSKGSRFSVSSLSLKPIGSAFARGESLYLSVREARERLQGLEKQFPCATWLPVICQNPGEMSLSWQELAGRVQQVRTDTPKKPRLNLSVVFLASVVISALVTEEAGDQGAALAGGKILELPCHKGERATKFIYAQK